MKISGIIVLCGIGVVTGCTGALQAINEDLKKANEALAAPKGSSAANETIGAPGGYQVQNVRIVIPDLSCGGKTYPETRDAYTGGFKRTYIQTWNGRIEVKHQGVLLATTPAQKERRSYLASHFIRWPKDAENAMDTYEIRTSRVTMSTSPYAGTPAEREQYWRASCVRAAYTKGSTQGRAQAQDDVLDVIEKAPPES